MADRADELTGHGEHLRRLARGMLYERTGGDQDDLVQDAWLAALRKRPRAGWSPRAWLSGVVRNLSLSKRREDERRRTRERAAARPEAQPAAVDSAARLETLRGVVDAVQALDEPYRTAILLRFFDGLTPRAIARRQGIPVNTVRTHVRRGLERLRAELDPGSPAASGERERFLAALAPLAGPLPWQIALELPAGSTTALTWSGIAMSSKVKLAAGAATVMVLSGVAWRMVGGVDGEAAWSEETEARAPALVPPVDHPEPVGPGEEIRTPDDPAVERGRAVVPADEGTAEGWVVRGTTVHGYTRALPHATVRLRLYEGYRWEGDPIAETSVTSDAKGRFEAAFDPPATPVYVRADAERDGFICSTDEAAVHRGDPPPEGLEVRFSPLDSTIAGRVVDDEGRPVEGAEVRAHRLRARTDPDGRYRVETSSVYSTIPVYARAEGLSQERVNVVPMGPGDLRAGDIVLQPEILVAGTVTDERGVPIPGAKVSTFPDLDTLTDDAGRYELHHVDPDGRWPYLTAAREGFAESSDRIDLSDGLARVEVDFELVRGVDISGRVVGPDRNPVEGVRVCWGFSPDATPLLEDWTDADGAFSFAGADRSRERLWVLRAGYARLYREIDVPTGASSLHGLEIVLEPGHFIGGTVTDAEGDPLPRIGVAVTRLMDYLPLHGRTDDDGRFRIDDVPDLPSMELELYADHIVRHEEPLTELDRDDLVIVLQRAGGLAGRVVDGVTGEPLDVFRIRFVRPAVEEGEERFGGYRAMWASEGVEFSGTDGYWSTTGEELEVGDVAGIEASAAGYAPTTDGHVVVEVDPDPDGLVSRLFRGSTVRGTVVAANGDPVAGAKVRRVTDSDPMSFSSGNEDGRILAITDLGGRFGMERVPGGEMRLAVDGAEVTPTVDGPFEVPSDGGLVERWIEVAVGGAVRGAVLDAEGSPVPGAKVDLRVDDVPDMAHRSWHRTAGDDGAFAFEHLPAGTYVLSQRLEHDFGSISGQTRELEVRDGETTAVDLRPLGTALLRGRLLFEGTLPGSMPVSIHPKGEVPGSDWHERLRGTIAHDGSFSISGVLPGAYWVTVDHYDPWRTRRIDGRAEVLLEAGTEADVVIRLEER